MILPNFIVIGAQRCGTTTLWEHLRTHPQVFVAPEKELDFFIHYYNWSRGRSWYESRFDGAGDALAVGEVSPNYTNFPALYGVPERIASMVPDVRLVYVMRDPIARMASSYLVSLELGHEDRPIDQALVLTAAYQHMSMYAMQIEQYLKFFSREQLLLFTTEEFNADAGGAMSRVFRFLGVDDAWVPPRLGAELHRGADKRVPRSWARAVWRAMIAARRTVDPSYWRRPSLNRVLSREVRPEELRIDPQLRERLADVLRPDVRRLRQWMGPDFDGWGLL